MIALIVIRMQVRLRFDINSECLLRMRKIGQLQCSLFVDTDPNEDPEDLPLKQKASVSNPMPNEFKEGKCHYCFPSVFSLH